MAIFKDFPHSAVSGVESYCVTQILSQIISQVTKFVFFSLRECKVSI